MDQLTYVDFDHNLADISICLENWGLIYNKRPIISQYISYILLTCTMIFCENYKTTDITDFSIKSFSSSPGILKHEDITYKSKSRELFVEIGKILSLFDSEKFRNVIQNPNVYAFSFYKQHENYEEAKMMWLELGFHL